MLHALYLLCQSSDVLITELRTLDKIKQATKLRSLDNLVRLSLFEKSVKNFLVITVSGLILLLDWHGIEKISLSGTHRRSTDLVALFPEREFPQAHKIL